jgi:hypothetical protein
MNINDDLREKLMILAFNLTDNFCYSCYKVVKADKCPSCGSDDFMRHLQGVGVEYGTEWVIEHLIKEHCSSIDEDELYEDLLNETCEKVKIGTLEYEAGYVLKNIDPVAFRCGVSDMLSDEDQYAEIDGQYYHVFDIENMIEELS